MCDYSLHAVKTRDAKVDDHLEVAGFSMSLATQGLCDPTDKETAVCLRPGTEVAFDGPVDYEGLVAPHDSGVVWTMPKLQLRCTVGQFVKINTDNQCAHHDAIQFVDGTIVLIQQLKQGQKLRVLQLPAEVQPATPEPFAADEPAAEAAPTAEPVA